MKQSPSHLGPDRLRLPRQAFHFLYFLSRKYARYALPALSVVFIAQASGVYNTYIFKELVDAIKASDPIMWQWAFIYVAIYALSTVGWRSSGFLGMRWMTFSRAQGAHLLYDYLSQHSSHYFSNRFAGSLATKVTNAANGISSMLSKILWEFYPTVLRLLLSIGIAWMAKPILALILGAWAVLFLTLNAILVRPKARLSRDAATAYTSLKGQMVDILTNIRAVHQFARRDAEMDHVDSHIDDFKQKVIRSWSYSERVLLLNNGLQVVLLLIMLVLNLRLLQLNILTMGEVIMMIQLTWGILDTLLFIGSSMNSMMESYGEVQDGLSEILKKHEIVDLYQARKLNVQKGRIMLDKVHFGYDPNRPVFQNFSLEIPAGQKVGLVGESGAGKSTLTQLLLRMYDVQKGSVSLDGQNIALHSQNSLRKAISYVPQSSNLFHRSIRENIRYGDPAATQEEIELAAKRARAHDFVLDLAEGYDTLVGERGVKLSGGQAQRISIARAMLKNAPILILDEATSSLDSESERMVQDALMELIQDKTVIAIAHRLSTLLAMDRILVMENGVIVEDGSHSELLEQGGTYARLWKHQVGGFLIEA